MELFMRKLILATLAATTAAAAIPAAAQDAGPFTGPRGGVILGYDAMRPGETEDSMIRGDQGSDGFLYGGDIGYDVAFNSLVVGVEGEITGSTGRVDNDPRDPSDFGYGRVKAGRDLYIGGRIGVLAAPRTLVYGKVGYTNARLDLTRSDTTTNTGRNFNLDGYRLGAGIEQSLTPNTYAKLEYRYSNYGDARLNYPDGSSTGTFGVDTDRHQVAVGAGFRF
jgi:outer membrane immunogenic protein